MKIRVFFILIWVVCSALAQTNTKANDTDVKRMDNSNPFNDYYPIATRPTFSFMSNMTSRETILFDAKPIVYYSAMNNIRKNMQDSTRISGNAIYVTFQPHIRMYAENSKPVKTPSYRLLFGWQHIKKVQGTNLLAFAFESGHYSNGQSGCTFLAGEEDETMPCSDFHTTITDDSNLSELLNRANGNFSTNTTKISLNYRINTLNGHREPIQSHSLSASWELYHNRFIGLLDFGGYSDFDISIYGRHRFRLGYEFIHAWKPKLRYSFSQKFELIQGAHPFVEPLRSETTFTLYPFNRDIGIFASYIYGHDNYNYRFVDSGNQISIGFTIDLFAPFEIKKVAQN